MPSVSKKQHNLMAMVAHDPAAAKRVGIPQSVGKEFTQADKGRKFRSGGMAKKLFGGKETYGEEKKEASALRSGKISPKQFVAGEKSEGHKEENSASLARRIKSGKMSPTAYAKMEGKEPKGMKCGGKVKRYEEGGDVETESVTAPTAASAQYKNFKDAFKSARASGDKTFEWEGKKYSTEMAKPEKTFAQKAKDRGFTSAETKGGAALMTRKDRGFKAGGSVRGCGIAKKGLTKGRMV